eukprot:GHVS01071586.1.p1 GENE.GHVS01071586.1~~GHVS01071586.1.p1  ORF type:complete len:215 (+),score=14.18 GHVS01071586.1:101-745(+)
MSKLVVEKAAPAAASKVSRAASCIGQPIYKKSNRRLRTVFAPQKYDYKPYNANQSSRMLLQHRPSVTSFPFETHVKRWPTAEEHGIRFMARFGLGRLEEVNLYEQMHCMPFRGVGCEFWRREGKKRWHRWTFFVPRKTEYQIRPFKAKVSGEMYCNDQLIRGNVSPRGSINGYWGCSVSPQMPWWHYRPPFPEPFISDDLSSSVRDDEGVTHRL